MKNRYIKTYESFNINIRKSLKDFYNGLKYEISENKRMREIIISYINTKNITSEEIDFIKNQSGDILKMLGIGSLIILPASSLIIPFLIKGAKAVGIDLIPNGFKNESMSENEILNAIQNGNKIFTKYINGYKDHDMNKSYNPIDIDDKGEILLEIDGEIYSTELDWVIGINEVSHYEVEPHMTEPLIDPKEKEIKDNYLNDSEFKELLKNNGGVSGLIKRIEDKYGIKYNKDISKEDLYNNLKSDGLM